MKITSFSFNDNRNDWHLSEVSFEDINLLVGLSGVGKTKILQSIMTLKNIANGQTVNGIKWNINFLDSNEKNYTWKGEFSVTDYLYNDDNKEECKSTILSENLICGEEILIKRENGNITYKGQAVFKLLPNKSVIYLLKEDPINNILLEINKILFFDHSYSILGRFFPPGYDKTKLLSEYKSINEILNSDLDMPSRLLWSAHNDEKLFTKIERNFCDIFPFVEHVRIDPLDDTYEAAGSQYFRDKPLIQIKEKNIRTWVPQFNISSGMYNALMHLCELYLCAENSLILIDELENSLGINCLSPISDEIVDNRKNTQFIITSHHPTIINNIEYNSWKVVTRNAKIVSVSNYDIDTSESAHDPYLQLINSIHYSDGITR